VIAPAVAIAQARSWVGVRFLHQGRTRFGADCLGFVAAFMAELHSMTMLDHLPRAYSRLPQEELTAGLARYCREIDLQPAALVLIQWPGTGFGSHAGIYTGENLIHCSAPEGKVVEHGYGRPWTHRTVSVWALPLVTYRCQGDSSAI
jgi:cell wall-associated NlpC family hydrolase